MKIAILLTFFLLLNCNKQKQNDIPKVISIGSLYYHDLREGLGANSIQNGDFITVDYAGWIISDSLKPELYSDWIIQKKHVNHLFQSSYVNKKPHQFTIGEGTVIKGWDIGLIGMKEGAKRILNVPALLAYGSRGFGNAINPNTDLRFEVEILKIERPKTSEIISEVLGSEMKISKHSIVKFHFKLNRFDDETVILQNSFNSNKPGQIKMDDPGLPHFIFSGLIGLGETGQRFLKIPEFKPRNLPEMKGQFKVLKVIDPVYPWQVEETQTVSLESGLKYNIIKPGSGNKLATGKRIQVHYSIYTITGKKLFSTIERDLPEYIIIDDPQVIQGLSSGLKLLKVGSKARLIIPESLAIAPDGSNQELPRNIKLVIDIDVLN